MPNASVTAVAVMDPPANVPLIPGFELGLGAAKVTVTFGTGMAFASDTRAWNRVPNAVPYTALCGDPATAVALVTGFGPLVLKNSVVLRAPTETVAVNAPVVSFAVTLTEMAPAAPVVKTTTGGPLIEAPPAGKLRVTGMFGISWP